MEQRLTLHIVDGSCRSRAEQARLGFEMGHHCEIYSDVAELMTLPPEDGIVLARDDHGEGCAAIVLRALGDAGIWIPVVGTSVEPRPGQVVTAIKAGALDYLRLPLRQERLGETVARIRREAIAYGEARRKMVEARSRIASLSPREREVLDWLAEGRSNKMIARELHISPRTVEIHRANMMTKLGAHHAAEAVRLRIEAHLDGGQRVQVG
ncbi:response regulator transcription factor [Qipengyuania sphaerica]|uniref:response regulator transcription factor n=1 Tax=Qipengyuania sphaerica TaxID=2867243 RepID=UPI001C8839DD|nr:LuxR C-terminal-related transcriptional regulator [Qipengyuania sphaerica]MBX7540091.1 LuxR C-terminal-related transcriptional regulator [Qipengyuania sphaerica]